MKRIYYLFNDGRMSRKDNTLCFVARDKDGNDQPAKYLPIETIESMFVFGALDVNAALINFLGHKQIPLHFYDYYEHYTGSFMPRDYLLAGMMQIEQTKAYLNKKQRLYVATQIVEAATFNMDKNLRYYLNRGRDMDDISSRLTNYRTAASKAANIPELMGLEGNCRQAYYEGFNLIVNGFEFEKRSKQPPENEVNAMISFGNMMCYTLALDAIYHTQLNPTISFLHEPGFRRFSLALDMAEIFKPILVDRTIFRLINKREVREEHFDKELNRCIINAAGKKIYVKAWEQKLSETIKHRKLGRNISYKHLVKLECYKLAKYLLNAENTYEGFKIWW